jgi:hypothetical protein
MGASLPRYRKRWAAWQWLVILVLQMQVAGSAPAGADEATEPLYPGRYVAHCKPAPISGCVCETDLLGQASTFSPVSSETEDRTDHIQDIEYRRMLEWLRLTCAAVTQSRDLRFYVDEDRRTNVRR